MMSRFQNCHFEYNLNKYSWRKQGNTFLHSEQCRLYSGQVLEYDSVQLPLSIHYCLSSQFNHCQAPSPISYLHMLFCHFSTLPPFLDSGQLELDSGDLHIDCSLQNNVHFNTFIRQKMILIKISSIIGFIVCL